MIDQIHWLGHGSFFIDGPARLYINPWRVNRPSQPADIILVSHDHFDHCSPADIEKLRAPQTVIIGSERVAREIEGCKVLRPWQSIGVGRVCVKAVPAYSPNHALHPAQEGGLGFVISANYYDIYYAGDTQQIPEMERIRADIALLPIDGNGTLTASDAARVVAQMRPRYAIPYNWGSALGSASHLDAQIFAQEVGDRSRVILPAAVR